MDIIKSYLEEIEEAELIAEIARRREARKGSVCDYCGRAPSASACKMEHRHYASDAHVVTPDRSLRLTQRSDVVLDAVLKFCNVPRSSLNSAGPSTVDVVATVVLQAATYWVMCPDDFAFQRLDVDGIVFGSTNRVIWTPGGGFQPDRSYCTEKFLKHYDLIGPDPRGWSK